jgi:hypothetical protein
MPQRLRVCGAAPKIVNPYVVTTYDDLWNYFGYSRKDLRLGVAIDDEYCIIKEFFDN